MRGQSSLAQSDNICNKLTDLLINLYCGIIIELQKETIRENQSGLHGETHWLHFKENYQLLVGAGWGLGGGWYFNPTRAISDDWVRNEGKTNISRQLVVVGTLPPSSH